MVRGVEHRGEFRKLYSKSSLIISSVVIVVGIIVYYFVGFGNAVECKDIACYKEYLLSCKKSYVTNGDDNYIYRYEILGESGSSYCNVDVRLIAVRSGSVNSEGLEGLNMICKVNKYGDILPEKDMKMCSGALREELQEIIIDKMHNQILQNIKQIKEEIKGN